MKVHIEHKPNNQAAVVRGYFHGTYEEKSKFVFVGTLFWQPDSTVQFCGALSVAEMARPEYIAIKRALKESGISNVVMERHGKWVPF